jgi:hypothetical protein
VEWLEASLMALHCFRKKGFQGLGCRCWAGPFNLV